MCRKIFFLFLSLWVVANFSGMVFFLYALVYGMPAVEPYPSNPFFLLSFFAFSFYLGWKRMQEEGRRVGLYNWDLVWFLLSGMNIVIWQQYVVHAEHGFISTVCRWITGINIVCWLIYTFLPKNRRYCLNILIFYFFLSALIYYSKNLFLD